MYGDSDNPDREFACQSGTSEGCVLPASRPDAQVFSDIHFYYHGVGGETRYQGTIAIGYLQASPDVHTSRINITVKNNESITNSSVTGIVTSKPDAYTVTIAVAATVADTKNTQRLDQTIRVIVK
jgi:hypothetical protein